MYISAWPIITFRPYPQFFISTILICLPRARKPVKSPLPHLTKWSAMTRVSASSYVPTKNPPTSFCDSVKIFC